MTAEKYVLRHHLGQVISQSFAATEQTFPSRASVLRLRGAYQLAARDHVTVLAASGDEGATAFRRDLTDLYTTRAVSWPATDPLVTAVGGTRLYLRANGTRRKAGHGLVRQRRGPVAVLRPAVLPVRACAPPPDGSAAYRTSRSTPPAPAPSSVYGSYGGNDGPWSTICGTSVATPLMAGLVALAGR